MDVFRLSASITLDTRDYEKSVGKATVSSSGITSALKGVDGASESLENKIKILGAQYSNANERVKELEKALAKSVKETGSASEQTLELAEQLAMAEREANDLQKEANELQKELDGLSEEASKTGNKFDSFANTLKNGLSSAGKVAANTLKDGLATALKTTAAALGAATTAVVALGKASIEGYAEYEQLVGGVETLFGNTEQQVAAIGGAAKKAVDAIEMLSTEAANIPDASDTIIEKASNAFKTAGMSANEYMDTVTSFSASLLQSLGGDTTAAAAYADKAITDMADNANKMGNSLESIQNAYQGIARQEYSMLENLRLGYSGNAREMARLVNDSGVLGDALIDLDDTKNLGTALQEVGFDKIIEAIHIIQTEMGITGTTAEEAANTISGSAASMKAAWENFLTGMADPNQDFDKLTGDLVDSVVTFGDNLIQRIMEMLPRLTEGIAALVSGLLPYIPETLNTLLPTLIDGATSLINGVTELLPEIITTAVNAIPQLVEAGTTIISNLASALFEAFPKLLPTLIDGATSLINGVTELLPEIITTAVSAIPQLVEAGASIISNLANALFEAFPVIAEAGGEVLTYLVDGLTNGLPELIPAAMDMILKIVDTLTKPDTLHNILDAALEILIALAVGLEDAIPQLVDAALTIIERLVLFLTDPKASMKIAGAAIQIVVSLAAGLVKSIPRLVESVAELIGSVKERFLETDWTQVGIDVINGVWDGLKRTWKNLTKWFSDSWDDLVGDVKDILGIHSPSRVFASIGGYMAEGLGEGWEDSFRKVKRQIEGGMDFETASIGFSASGLGRNESAISSAAAAVDERPILITLKSVLDGKELGESSYRYAKNKERMYGTT